MSTTKIARSHKDDPRLRRLVKDSCPGVSITNNPGILISLVLKFSGILSNSFLKFWMGK